jgi:hypothetical protein
MVSGLIGAAMAAWERDEAAEELDGKPQTGGPYVDALPTLSFVECAALPSETGPAGRKPYPPRNQRIRSRKRR